MLAQPLVGQVLRQALDAQARVPGARHLRAVRSGGVGQGSEDDVRHQLRAAKSKRSRAARSRQCACPTRSRKVPGPHHFSSSHVKIEYQGLDTLWFTGV
jgi:hypothetical protein